MARMGLGPVPVDAELNSLSSEANLLEGVNPPPENGRKISKTCSNFMTKHRIDMGPVPVDSELNSLSSEANL